MDNRSILNDPQLTTLLFAVLVKRLGGNTEIRQEDIDAVAYNWLEEDVETDGSIGFRLVERHRTS